MSLDAMKLALELLESAHVATDLVWKRYDCITALRAAIEQAQSASPPVQESALTHNHLWIGDLHGREKNT